LNFLVGSWSAAVGIGNAGTGAIFIALSEAFGRPLAHPGSGSWPSDGAAAQRSASAARTCDNQRIECICHLLDLPVARLLNHPRTSFAGRGCSLASAETAVNNATANAQYDRADAPSNLLATLRADACSHSSPCTSRRASRSAFAATAIATQLRRQGVGPAEIGAFVGSFYLPWAFKWAFGPSSTCSARSASATGAAGSCSRSDHGATLLSLVAVPLPQGWPVHRHPAGAQHLRRDPGRGDRLAGGQHAGEHERGWPTA
jgi:hypothetical protein